MTDFMSQMIAPFVPSYGKYFMPSYGQYDNYTGKNNNPGPRALRKQERQRRDLNYRKRRERGRSRK